MKTNNFEVGRIGENIACRFLIKKGYQIIERNHRERSDEIDIIGISPERTLVFIEVKTLVGGFIDSSRRLMPEDQLTAWKLKKISRACMIFVGKHPELVDPEKGWRIDLVAIALDRDGWVAKMDHYENI